MVGKVQAPLQMSIDTNSITLKSNACLDLEKIQLLSGNL